MPNNHNEIEKKLWSVADQLRANSNLKAAEYSVPVLGLIFLRFADYKFTLAKEELEKKQKSGGRRGVSKVDYQAMKGVLYLPEKARFSYLLNLPEGENIGKAIIDAMKAIEAENEELKDILPKTYNRLENSVLVTLLKTFSSIPMDIEGDVFGKIYEYFLGEFAKTEGQRGGEFYTPTAIVKLIVEVIEPYHGRIYDPACGSGGMFVQSAKFVERHKHNPNAEIAIYGQEKTAETLRLCKMNCAVHGLSGDIRQGNTYYEDEHKSLGKFDFVMANPPFNVDGVDKEKIKDDKRFSYGIPKPDNGNYLWMQIFLNALNNKGRTGFVMANSAADARASEMEIRKKMIEDNVVDVMISIGTNFFYTVTLPCTLWFFDKGKKDTNRKDKALFIDARNIYTDIDRAHREFTPTQIEFISNIVRLYRDEKAEVECGSDEMTKKNFPNGKYKNIAGLCKIATIKEIAGEGYSLNPGRYVGVAERGEEDFDFKEKIEELNEELERLNGESHKLEDKIANNAEKLFESK
ncbi:MAG: class I SAM-dependent DNA methyltransferase [Candidatus Aenigmarchaeota archaeon]|nr:class I SAM-dependent DNA methyltransferase [Candidatus Aenigmarchaeota archaeon]